MKRRVSLAIAMVMVLATLFSLTAMAAGETLEAPQGLTVEVKERPDGKPYFLLKWTNPESILDLVKYWDENGEAYVDYQIDMKVGNGRWNYDVIGNTITGNSLHAGYDETEIYAIREAAYDPINDGELDTIDIKANVYQFRVRYSYLTSDDEDREVEYYIYSPFSNVASVGMEAYYKNASGWAEPELDKAAGYGLIPDILKGADMTKPITREEFAELAVLLYEKASGKTAVPVSPNPFTDTNNPQILKAFATGITAGTSATTFSPDVLINREQCATMLYRTIKAIAPDADYSIAGVADFPDQKDISDWAVEGTKYMFKLGIIKGDASGNFMPKATTTAQQAAGYGMATREAAVLMTVRTYEKMDDISATKQVSDTGGGGDFTSLPEGYPSDIIPLYKNGKIVSVEKKTFDTGDVGYAITIDYEGEKTSEVNGHYAGLMMQADNYDGTIGVKSHHYGNLGGYRIEIDFTQHFPDQYSCTVVIAYYKTN